MEGSVGRERSTAPGVPDAKEGNLLDAAYAAAPVGLGLLDADLRFIKANHLFARFDGVEPAEHLVPALDRLLTQVREREGVASDLVAEIGDERLRPGIEATVYRVVQEAVTNALRHGEATTVSVVLTRRAAVLTAVVEDDGRGFDVAARSGGFGMLGMRERAALTGGSRLVDSSPGVGTTVRLEVALEK